MNPTATPVLDDRAQDGTPATETRIRPRFEGSNICTWIGFKHVNYMVEEAVLDHLRQRGHPAGALYERYGLGLDIVDVDTRIQHAFHIDDVAVARVRETGRDGALRLSVTLSVERDGQEVKAVGSEVAVALRLDPHGSPTEPAPPELADVVVDRLGTTVETVPVDGDPLAALVESRNAVGWSWRMPYFYCHFTERVQMSGYLRQMEEVLDLFLADRGVSIKRLLDEQDWIPVVPNSRIRILSEALMEEELHTVFTVQNVFKRHTFTARMDCYVVRDGALVPVATGTITHGWAHIDSRRDWSLVAFDDRLTDALHGRGPGAGQDGTVAGRGRRAS